MNPKLVPLIFFSACLFASDNFALPTLDEARAAAEKDQKPILVIITAPGDVAAIDAQHWLAGQRVLGKDGEKFHFCTRPREKKSREPALKFLNTKGETICVTQVPDTRKALKNLAERVLKSDGKPITIESRKPVDFISPAMKDPQAIPKALAAVQAFIVREMPREEVAEACQFMTTAVMLLNLETVRALLTEKILKAAGPSRAIADSLLDLADEALAHGQTELAKKCWKAAKDAAKDESPVLFKTAKKMQVMLFLNKLDEYKKFEERKVADVVVLVSNPESYFSAIASWNSEEFFPVLFEDSWFASKFIQAFKPAKVVRLDTGTAFAKSPLSSESALEVLRRSAKPMEKQREFGFTLSPPRPRGGLPVEPNGVVIADPESGEIAGGVALAAGRFQGIALFSPPRHGEKTSSVQEHLTIGEAKNFAHAIDTELFENWILPGNGDLHYITLAGNYPYRYTGSDDNMGFGTTYCLDDLIGRSEDSTRHSVVGRLIGDKTQSAYQAMCSLFLQPSDLFCFNTYGTNPASIWGFYNMDFAASAFEKTLKVTHLHDGAANITSFRNAVMPGNKFGLMFINSSGGAGDWSVGGGGGSADDFPIGSPLAIHVTHSGSAGNPYDINTLAGRALRGGAFYYWGSTAEPFLSSFQPPRYYAPRLAAGVPFSATFRRRPGQEFWQPWRLIAIGDPQFGLRRTPAVRVPYDAEKYPYIARTANFVSPERAGEVDTNSAAEKQILARYSATKLTDDALVKDDFEVVKKSLANVMKTNPAHNYLRRTLDSAGAVAKKIGKAEDFANWLREISAKAENAGVKRVTEEQLKKVESKPK